MPANANQPQIIKGNRHKDHRGEIRFINDFDMSAVRRFYCIIQPDTSIIRGWRGHKIEQRWFYVNRGIFRIKLIQIDDWEIPSNNLEQITYILNAEDDCILYVPNGYATAIQAVQPNSELTIFADHYIDSAQNDNYLYPIEYFGKWK